MSLDVLRLMRMLLIILLARFLFNIAAGSDATAISLPAVLYYLLNNIRYMRVLQAKFKIYTAETRLLTFMKFAEVQKILYL